MITLVDRLRLASREAKEIQVRGLYLEGRILLSAALLSSLLEEAAEALEVSEEKTMEESLARMHGIPKCRSKAETDEFSTSDPSGIPHNWTEWCKSIDNRVKELEGKVEKLEAQVRRLKTNHPGIDHESKPLH